MSKIYKFCDYAKIAKVGDVVKFAEKKGEGCFKLEQNDSCKITLVNNDIIRIDGCPHHISVTWLIELMTPHEKTWDTLASGDILESQGLKTKVLAVIGDVFLYSQFGLFDEARYWVTKKESQRGGWTIVQDPPVEDVEEVTLDQIEAKFGKKVKIKNVEGV